MATLNRLNIRSRKSISGIELDAVLEESHSHSVRLTKNPVEFGADITDHAVIEPSKLTIIGVVSDSPLYDLQLGPLIDSSASFGTTTDDNVTRSSAAYNAMLDLMRLREPVTVQTNLKLYENFVIVNVSTSQDKDSVNVVELHIELEEVIITTSETVTLTADQLAKGSARNQAITEQNGGRQESKKPAENAEKSILKSIVDFIKGDE